MYSQHITQHNFLYKIHDQGHGTDLSQTIAKIEELKRLMNKYPQYHTNPDDTIRLAW
jgi:hypothetical protein